jgi:hypothetical protein
MRTSTQIEFNLTIKDINAKYSKNYNAMLLRQTKDLYENKCMDQQYILSIDRIIKRSQPNLIRRDLDAKVRIFVIVEATVLRFDKYDTVTNMTVNKIIPKSKIGPTDLLECSNEYSRALIKLDDKLTGFKIGDTIPIKVGAALLKIQNSQVLINAYPFVPHKMDKIAYLVPKLTTYDQEQINSTLGSLIETKVQELSMVDATRAKYFKQLLYPFLVASKSTIGIQYNLSQVLQELSKYEGKAIYIDQGINLSDLKVSIVTAAQADSNELVWATNPNFASIIVYTFAKHLNLISSLSLTYIDQNVFEQHQYLWDLYAQNRF